MVKWDWRDVEVIVHMSISQKGEGNMYLASLQKELHVLCYAVV